ncbi:hypothetical protein BLOT_012131 [Blomia tropicalis]|nr:hypothetical protein BLOT_012131 [Blomia tropicalis]
MNTKSYKTVFYLQLNEANSSEVFSNFCLIIFSEKCRAIEETSSRSFPINSLHSYMFRQKETRTQFWPNPLASVMTNKSISAT